MPARALRALLTSLLVACAAATSAQATSPLDRLPHGLQVGVYSPEHEAAAQRAEAPFGLRYFYVTHGVRAGHEHDPSAPEGRLVADWLRESAAQDMVPVLTYYQLQPSSRSGNGELARVASALRRPATMRAYWRDLRATLRLAAADPQQLVVLHAEPDTWQYLEQLQGTRTRVVVGATGISELKGLPNDARGFAQAFVRLRDRYAPNVALAWHLSPWGMGQVVPGSVENSTHMGQLRAAFLRRLGARFDLAFEDPKREPFDDATFAQHLALVRAFNAGSGLPVMLWQVWAEDYASWFLDGSDAARARLAAERGAGVRAIMFYAGEADRPTPGRGVLFAGTASGYASGLLG